MPNLILCDIDGTIADCSHRLYLTHRDPVDWVEFEEAANLDTPIMSTIHFLRRFMLGGGHVWYWTGRTTHIRDLTEQWITKHVGLAPEQLLMRTPEAAEREPVEMAKLRWWQTVVPQDRTICALEDDGRVIKVLSEAGLPMYQVIKQE